MKSKLHLVQGRQAALVTTNHGIPVTTHTATVDGGFFHSTQGHAVFAPGRGRRYLLSRTWAKGERVCFVCCNPSTADERGDDNTSSILTTFAHAWKFAGFVLVNIFSIVGTNPLCLYQEGADPVGKGNDAFIKEAAESCRQVVCAWGNHGTHLARGEAVRELLLGCTDRVWPSLHCFKVTKMNQPQHPLYLQRALQPTIWDPSRFER